MRLFLFLFILLLPAISFGQACTQATLSIPDTNADGDANPNTYPCTTLTISSAGLNRAADGSAGPVIVTVTGNVTISGNINVNGGDGFTLTIDPTTGPLGGPGATAGGGLSLTDGEPLFSLNPEDGLAPPRNAGCNDGGGGGGGYNLAGDPGLECDNDPSASATGGASWGAVFPLLRGGFGGGAGGAHDNGLVFNLGSGGGGGGAIHIISTGGSITVAKGVTISARGGRGGNAGNIGGGGFGGAGGGGSGGVILLDGFLGVVNNGVLDVRGGAGGSGPGGEGGAGKSGVYRIALNGVPTDEGTGLLGSLPGSGVSYKSDITCGTIAAKKAEQNQNLIFQMMMGFLLIVLLKTLFRFPKKVA